MRRALRRLLGAIAVLITGSGARAAIADVPAQFRPTVACMMQALRTEPHIHGVSAGMNAPVSFDTEPVRQPYVEYRTLGRDGEPGTIRFYGSVWRGKLYFHTGLNGLSAVGGPGPDDWRTSRVIDLWKTRCGVGADAVYN